MFRLNHVGCCSWSWSRSWSLVRGDKREAERSLDSLQFHSWSCSSFIIFLYSCDLFHSLILITHSSRYNMTLTMVKHQLVRYSWVQWVPNIWFENHKTLTLLFYVLLYRPLVFKDCTPKLQLYIDSVCSGGGNVDSASEIKDDQVALFSYAAVRSPLSVTRTLEKLIHSSKERII